MPRKGSVVKSEMGGGFGNTNKTGAPGRYDSSPAPFDKPRARGGVPVKMYDQSVSTKPLTPTQTSGRETRAPRPGTKQNSYGRSDQ